MSERRLMWEIGMTSLCSIDNYYMALADVNGLKLETWVIIGPVHLRLNILIIVNSAKGNANQ